MTELLCLLLRPALVCVSNPRRYWYFAPITVLAWVIDVVLCHTFWPLLAGWPQRGEYTISDTLERLCADYHHPDRLLFVGMARKINRLDPLRSHIKSVL